MSNQETKASGPTGPDNSLSNNEGNNTAPPPPTEFMRAVLAHDVEAARRALDAGADINQVDHENMTAVLYSIVGQDTPMLELLLSRGANLEHGEPGEKALDLAIITQDLDVIRKLVQAGADLNNLIDGRTHLHTAIRGLYDSRNDAKTRYYKDLIRALMRPGMKISTKDRSGKVVYELLMEGAQYELARELLINAAQAAPMPRVITFFKNTSNRKYTFSQRGSTCGPDAFFSMCFFSDLTRPYFRAAASAIERGDTSIQGIDGLGAGIAAAARRFTKVKELQHRFETVNTGPLRKRRPSIGPLCDAMGMKSGITGEAANEESGIDVNHVTQASRAIFTENRYGIFPAPAMVKFVMFDMLEDPDRTPPDPIPIQRDLDITAIEGIYVGLNHEITDFNLIAANRFGSDLPSGHGISFFKHHGQWVLSDNESQFLHVFKDQTFIRDHFLPTLRDNVNKIKIKFLPIFHSIGIIIQTPTATYPQVAITEPFGQWKYTIGSGVIYMRGDAPVAALVPLSGAASANNGVGHGAGAAAVAPVAAANAKLGGRRRTRAHQRKAHPKNRRSRRRQGKA
jgi:hypothetical protein